MSDSMRASDLLVKCLEAEGVERIFGIPGEENLDVMDSLKDSNIEFVLTRHENSAAFIASTCGRLTGRPHVCLSTLGPGATNMVTGVAEAFLSYIPMVAITGQVGADQAFAPRKQYLDLVQLFRPVTKESFSMRSPLRIPAQVRRAFHVASLEKPGPVLMELPEDVMKMQAEGRPLKRGATHHVGCDPSSVKKVIALLKRSRRPMVLAGPGTIRAGAAEELRRFSRAWGIPIAHTWHGSGIMPYDDALSLNTVGLRTKDTIRQLFEEMDTVVLVGYDLPEFLPVFWNTGASKQIVVIDPAPTEAVPHLDVDVQLVGQIGEVLSQLTAGAAKKRNWAEGHRENLDQCLNGCPPDTSPVKPQLAVRAIRSSLGREDLCTCDVGAHLIWMAKMYPVYKENTLLLSNGLLPMGIGVPSAIGAKLVHPEKKVVAVCGDGGFMMTAAELETATRLGTRFVTVLFNDSGLGLIKYKHRKAYGRDHGADFGNPDMVDFARSFGAEGYRATTAKELREMIVASLEADELAVIDVPIDYTENKNLL